METTHNAMTQNVNTISETMNIVHAVDSIIETDHKYSQEEFESILVNCHSHVIHWVEMYAEDEDNNENMSFSEWLEYLEYPSYDGDEISDFQESNTAIWQGCEIPGWAK